MLANYGLKVPIRREAAIQRDIVDSVPHSALLQPLAFCSILMNIHFKSKKKIGSLFSRHGVAPLYVCWR